MMQYGYLSNFKTARSQVVKVKVVLAYLMLQKINAAIHKMYRHMIAHKSAPHLYCPSTV